MTTPLTWTMLARQRDYWWTRFARTWRGSVISAVLSPLLYLGAMGVMLGRYVDDAGRLGTSYAGYIVPGLLAGTAMQIAIGETTYPVLGAIMWDKTYVAMVATPLRVVDIVRGHLLSVAVRVLAASSVFTATILLLGVRGGSVLGVLGALAVQPLVALAFAAPVYAVATRAQRDSVFAVIYRVVVAPLFLFSGAFFPVGNLPPGLRTVATWSPLYHGVELTRGLFHWAGSPLVLLGHAAYLAVLAAIGFRLAVTGLEKRLLS